MIPIRSSLKAARAMGRGLSGTGAEDGIKGRRKMDKIRERPTFVLLGTAVLPKKGAANISPVTLRKRRLKARMEWKSKPERFIFSGYRGGD
jgi:hypothetical protein